MKNFVWITPTKYLMINYKITFEGVGYNILTETEQKIGGFFVSVLATAPDPEQAFEIAYQKLIDSQAYQDLAAVHAHPNAVLSVYQYSEIRGEDSDTKNISGFVFYPPDEQASENIVAKH